uniref:Uncharacterized protein n=1 Tax=Fagus sylvatica TaxID=28930 RepID=A0A2N9HXA2_FAGSY
MVGMRSTSPMEKQQWVGSQKEASASSKPRSTCSRMKGGNLPKIPTISAWSSSPRRVHQCLIRSTRKGEENSKNGCWFEGEPEFKKPGTRASPSCAAHDGHARVPLGIPTALSPMSREFEPVRSLPEVRFALYKGHFARNHLGESPGRSGDRRFRVNEQKPTRNPRTGPEVKSGTRSGLKQKHLMRCDQD